jgi:hypothetical protein
MEEQGRNGESGSQCVLWKNHGAREICVSELLILRGLARFDEILAGAIVALAEPMTKRSRRLALGFSLNDSTLL